MKIISADGAANLIQDYWTVIPGGFGSCGHPDALTRAIEKRFIESGQPCGLTLLFAAGAGDRADRGINALAHEGLVQRAIGGFWGLVPRLGDLVSRNLIEAHNWPQGVISQIFRASAAGLPGIISRTGLGTFVDPDAEGGRLNRRTPVSLIRKIAIDSEIVLFYPTQPIHCVLLRGTASDPAGNISAENEVSFQDSLAQAMATKNNSGIVIVQVEKLVPEYSIHPHNVRIPGMLVDYVVLSSPEDHWQTYGNDYAIEFTEPGPANRKDISLPVAHRIIASRALEELRKKPGAIVNLGIGIPASIGQIAAEVNYTDFTVTVESGQIGGVPASGLSFGASSHPSAVIEQSALFDFYDGGGIDIAYLGFAEIDGTGSVNVSRFSDRIQGAGGFINISQSAKKVIFCGTFTAGGIEVKLVNGKLRIEQEGTKKKFLHEVSHLTFSGKSATNNGQSVMYVTERAVFSLSNGVLRLDEVAPGIDIETDIIPHMDTNFIISANCKVMNSEHFSEEHQNNACCKLQLLI